MAAYVLPLRLKNILVAGLDVEPEKRGDMKCHTQSLNTLSVQLSEIGNDYGDDENEVEWTTLKWWSLYHEVPDGGPARFSTSWESEMNTSSSIERPNYNESDYSDP
ncbi:hypothetical protein BT69DRAFT_1280725 [Atractiella rhizophila]|nr:hypothetical protein BT69DRAFT_1280725 [Atractiella rhizophila]